MNKLLQILGTGFASDIADLILHWLNVVNPPQNDRSAKAEQLDKIVELFEQGKTDTAEGETKLYLFENPQCSQGRLAAAAIYIHKNLIQNAIEHLLAVFEREPNNTMALYALGHCYERLGQEAKAIEFYQDCLKFKNYLQFPRQRLAAIYFKNCQLEKTIHEYELLKQEYPDDVSSLVTLGYLYIACGKYPKAVETFNKAILMHPDNFLATEDDRIEQLIDEGQPQAALEQIDTLLQQEPKRADLIVKRADILNLLGDSEEAVSLYEEAISRYPDFLEAAIKLGTQYLKLHQNHHAAKQFNRAIEINDQIVDAYIGLAIAQKSDQNIPEALATLSLAAAIQPNSSLLFAETATLKFETSLTTNILPDMQGQHSNLIEAVIKAHKYQIASQPQNADLYYRLGILMMSVERASEAIKAFETALAINPAYHRARSKLAMCLFEKGSKQDALKQLAQPARIDKDVLELHYKIALLYCNKLKFASSLMNLQRSMENNFACSNSTTVNISIVLQNLGLLDRATAMWDNLADTTNHAINTNQSF